MGGPENWRDSGILGGWPGKGSGNEEKWPKEESEQKEQS